MAEKADVRAELDAALAEIEQVVTEVEEAAWSNASPNPGWSARDVLTHLISGETGNLQIARRVQAGEARPVEGFDLARWNARQLEKIGVKQPGEVMSELKALRAETLSFLESVSEADLSKAGFRPTGEATTLEGVFRQIANHQREHAADIRSAAER